MRKAKHGVVAVALLALSMLMGCAASRHSLTIGDIEPRLSGLNLEIGDEEGVVEYYQIGRRDFDAFFKSAAKVDGLVIITEGMTRTATGQLKNYAKSKAADEALKESIAELVGDTPPEDWTTAQCVAVMQIAKQQDKVNADERKYFLTTAGSMAVGVVALTKGISTTKDLIVQGTALTKKVGSLKFTPWKIPQASKALEGTLENLRRVERNAPETLEEMKVLVEAFKMLGGE